MPAARSASESSSSPARVVAVATRPRARGDLGRVPSSRRRSASRAARGARRSAGPRARACAPATRAARRATCLGSPRTSTCGRRRCARRATRRRRRCVSSSAHVRGDPVVVERDRASRARGRARSRKSTCTSRRSFRKSGTVQTSQRSRTALLAASGARDSVTYREPVERRGVVGLRAIVERIAARRGHVQRLAQRRRAMRTIEDVVPPPHAADGREPVRLDRGARPRPADRAA